MLMHKMNVNKRLAFVRYGDNDIMQMVGKSEYGRDLIEIAKPLGNNRTVYHPKVGERIRNGFQIKDENYMKAVTAFWPKEPHMEGTPFDPDVKSQRLPAFIQELTDETVFYNPVAFHYLAIFQPLLWKKFRDNHIKHKKKVYVGANHPKQLADYLGKIDFWVDTPRKNAPSQETVVWMYLEKVLNAEKPDLVILACGQLSRILAPKIWNKRYETHTIDIGSVVDAYAGYKSRRYLIDFGDLITMYK
jgi:hypothetical protein